MRVLMTLILFCAAAPGIADLGACEDERFGPRARCGSIRVLENRSDVEGREIDLNVVVLRAEREADRAPLFLLAGGPGQAATDLAGLALGPFAPSLSDRDVVLVDQRGTGRSNRLDCPLDAAEDPSSVFGRLFDRSRARVCLDAISKHADPALYGTIQVVADLEEVRARLGYERVFLWGGSGGTRTALLWMKEFPESVEAAVIDGVTPTTFRSPMPFAPGAQASLEHVFEDCAAQPACQEAYPNLSKDFARVLALFDDGPVETIVQSQNGEVVPVEMHRGDFAYSVRGILYNARLSAELPALIHQAADSSDVGKFAQRYWQRQVALRPAIAMGVHFGVICTEDMPFIDPEEAGELAEGTFLGTYLLEQYGGVCEEWARGEVPEDYLEPVTADVPVLIVSGYYDPSTPPRMGEEVARNLTNSRHIVARNEGHGAEFGCARGVVLEFLASGSLEGLGGACEDAGPIVFDVP